MMMIAMLVITTGDLEKMTPLVNTSIYPRSRIKPLLLLLLLSRLCRILHTMGNSQSTTAAANSAAPQEQVIRPQEPSTSVQVSPAHNHQLLTDEHEPD